MPVHKLGATRISQKMGDYIRKSTRFEVFCLFCLSLNFLPLTRISAVFAPIALLPFLVALVINKLDLLICPNFHF